MLIIWRGFGWVIPIIVVASFLVSQISLDALYGDAYYKGHEWPKILAIIVSAFILGILGYFLNYKKRIVTINEETGKKEKSPSHTLFLIPIEIWAVIVPVVFFWMVNYNAKQDAQDLAYIASPRINDKYFVDFTKILDGADNEYKYGIMKVSKVTTQNVEFLISKIAYNKKSGLTNDISKGKVNEDGYFSIESTVFRKDELANLKKIDAIYSVLR